MGLASGVAQQQTLVDLWYQWAYAVLNGIGAPTSQTNIQTLWNWSIKESGATPIVNGNIVNNPLNTTQPAPGSVSRNSAGVQAYPDVSTGASATAQTLLNGYYPAIVGALRSSTPTSQWGSNPSIVQELGTWGSGANWLGWNNKAPQPSSQFQNTVESSTTFTNSSGSNPVQDAINSALSPIGTAITGATNTLVEKLTYGVVTATGVFLMALGFIVLILPLIGRGASVAANATPEGRAASTAAAVAAPKPKPAPAAPAKLARTPARTVGGKVSTTSTEGQIAANRRNIGQ